MSRRTERPDRNATHYEIWEWNIAQLARHSELWSYWRAIYDADENPYGRATRAVRAAMRRFGIDRTTVQRKVEIVQPIVDRLNAGEAVNLGYSDWPACERQMKWLKKVSSDEAERLKFLHALRAEISADKPTIQKLAKHRGRRRPR